MKMRITSKPIDEKDVDTILAMYKCGISEVECVYRGEEAMRKFLELAENLRGPEEERRSIFNLHAKTNLGRERS